MPCLRLSFDLYELHGEAIDRIGDLTYKRQAS